MEDPASIDESWPPSKASTEDTTSTRAVRFRPEPDESGRFLSGKKYEWKKAVVGEERSDENVLNRVGTPVGGGDETFCFFSSFLLLEVTPGSTLRKKREQSGYTGTRRKAERNPTLTMSGSGKPACPNQRMLTIITIAM
eukprot:2919335-Rhodomonas_salina.3